MLRFAAGELIAQIVADGTVREVYQNNALATEITLVLAPTGNVQLFHDDQGTGVFPDKQVLSAPFQSQGAGTGIFVKKGGRLAVSGAGTVSIYGITENQRQ